MRSSVKSRTRAFLLVILAAVILVQCLSLYLREMPIGDPSHQHRMDFLLEVYGEPGGVEFSGSTPPNLPQFDPKSETWTFNGQQVSEFADFIQGLEVGPHGSSPLIVVAIPDDGTVADYRRALASLSSHGICRVGVYSPLSNTEFVSFRADRTRSSEIFVPVYRVLSIQRDGGVASVCKDRFPAFAPWAT